MSAPTILFIYCDELRADVLSCYGGPAGLTPHIDRIAASGARFDASWCSSPVCVPSRWCSLTGLPATQTGVFHNEAAWPGYELPVRPTTVVEHLTEAGWFTANVGKIHLPRGVQPFAEHHNANGDMGGIYNAIDRNHLDLQTPPGLETTIGGRWPDELPFPPEDVTSTCIDLLSQNENQPRFIRASYLQPHTPVTPPQRYVDRVIELDPDLSSYTRQGTPSQFEQSAADNIGGAAMPAEQTARCQLDYLALVAWLDDQVGQLLDAVEMCDGPVSVVFSADHGAALGESGLWAKQCFAPFVHRVPLLISAPGRLTPGSTIDLDCVSTDLAPTIASLADVAPLAGWAGRDLTAAMSDAPVCSIIGFGDPDSFQFPNKRYGRTTSDGGWPQRACVRHRGWRYERTVRQDGKPITADSNAADSVLINAVEDPSETVNVINDPRYADVQSALTTHLEAWLSDILNEPAATRD